MRPNPGSASVQDGEGNDETGRVPPVELSDEIAPRHWTFETFGDADRRTRGALINGATGRTVNVSTRPWHCAACDAPEVLRGVCIFRDSCAGPLTREPSLRPQETT